MNKKAISWVLMFCMIFSSMGFSLQSFAAGGFKHPAKAFKLFEAQKLAEKKSVNDYISAVKAVVDLYEQFSICKDVSSVLAPRYKVLAIKYMDKKDFKNAYFYMKKHRDITIKRMKDYGFSEEDNLIDANRFLKVLDYEPKVFAYTKNRKHFFDLGTVYEQGMGVFFGRPSTVDDTVYKDSATLVYVEFGKNDISEFSYLIDQKQNKSKVLQIAWNFPDEMKTCGKIVSGATDKYIVNNLNYLKTLGMPVILRIGAEQNAWTNTNPDLYKKAYIKIADSARKIAPNVALAFSVNYIGSRDYDYLDFYPGDEYVDWVGVSLYLNKYFKSLNESDQDMMTYGVGKYADPVVLMKPIVDAFGGKKPIYIAESGSGYWFKNGQKDVTSYSLNRTNQLFGALPMVYPEIRGIIHFDTDVSTSKYRYKLSGNKSVEAKYNYLTEFLPIYKKSLTDDTGYSEKIEKFSDRVGDELFIGTYVNSILYPSVTVKYYLNDKLLGSVSDNPTFIKVKKGDILLAENKFKVVFDFGNGVLMQKQYSMFRGSGDVVTIRNKKTLGSKVTALPSRQRVIIDGKPVSFEAYNIGGNNFFKLRDLASALMKSNKKFGVSWNDKTRLVGLTRESDYLPNGSELKIPANMKVENPIANSAKLEIDGVGIEVLMYNIKGNNFIKLRNMGQLIDFGIDYNSQKKLIEIDTNDNYDPE